MRISFFGACREVTGSNFLVETEGAKVLLDCGFFQGYRLNEERNWLPFAFRPQDVGEVVICHAHLDHTGRLPKLVKEGFRGRIFSTEPTRNLTRLVLEDNEKLMREEAERENHSVLYNRVDIENVMNLFETLAYGERVDIAKGVYLTLRDAGHILGSATATIEADNKTLVYTSDLGNTPSLLLNPPEVIESADVVICESTYGGRVHEEISKRKEKLAAIIRSTISKNGILLIPSFAIERTQELLHDIEDFCDIDGCEKPQFYLDSPLAEKVTAVFRHFPQFLSDNLKREHSDSDFFGLSRLKITSSVNESKQIKSEPNPKVIIAGSGMMNGGRILYHARDFLEDERNCLLIVGYQSTGTLGRRILDGEGEIKILGKQIKIRATVLAIGSYSAHADRPQLLSWIGKISGLKKVFLVHGEVEQMIKLSENIRGKLNIECDLPQQGQEVEV